MSNSGNEQNLVNLRKEILFLYDVTEANPNGDPAEENRPRMDEETGHNIVTDVRLKRTIRDYWHDIEKREIFVRQISDEEGNLQDAKARARDFLPSTLKGKKYEEQRREIEASILEQCIDVRTFGATIPLELSVEKSEKKGKTGTKSVKGSITLTGPVQFGMGRSLHRVKVKYIKGTGAFASGEKKAQQTFREEYILPYSLIAFHGIVNEVRAKETRLTEDDVQALYRGLWWGTKNLITRSKSGHAPRLLMVMEYSEKYYHIGDLMHKIGLKHDLPSDEEIRSIKDVSVDVTELTKSLVAHKDKINKILVFADEAVTFVDRSKGESPFTDIIAHFKESDLPAEQLNLPTPQQAVQS